MPLDDARTTGANLITPAALQAARARTSVVERHQSFDHERLWADLLSSEALAFNLFGGLAQDLSTATTLVESWFSDAPGPTTATATCKSLPGPAASDSGQRTRSWDHTVTCKAWLEHLSDDVTSMTREQFLDTGTAAERHGRPVRRPVCARWQ